MDRLLLREDSSPTVAGRTLTIRIASYNRVYQVPGRGPRPTRERILPGAFREPLARPRGSLRFRHIGERPGDTDDLDNFYGTLTALREEDGGVVGDFEVFPGEREDKLLRLVSTGAVTGASMAAVIRESKAGRDPGGPTVDITRIGSLDGVSITPNPNYSDARVLAIREELPQVDPAARATRLAAERAYWEQARQKAYSAKQLGR